jgi:hypothetical protein
MIIWCVCPDGESVLAPDAEPGLVQCVKCGGMTCWIPREGLTDAQRAKMAEAGISLVNPKDIDTP